MPGMIHFAGEYPGRSFRASGSSWHKSLFIPNRSEYDLAAGVESGPGIIECIDRGIGLKMDVPLQIDAFQYIGQEVLDAMCA